MPPGKVAPGAKKKNKKKEKIRKKIQRPGDFTAMILFSSLSMSTFTDWMNEKFKSTKQPNTFNYPITNLAWSQPKGPGYQGGFDETIFVDCSSDIAKIYESGDDGEQALLVYLSFAISRLKECMKTRTDDGMYGTVHCTICAYHPVEKLLFALSELLNNSLAYSSVYSSFVGYIKGIEEFRLAFRAIQKDKWKIVVDYCGVFDPYQAIANDKKGDAQRAEEMAKIMEDMPPDPTDLRYIMGNGGFDDGGIGAAVAYQTTGNFSHLDGGYDRDCKEWSKGDPEHRKYINGQRSIFYEGKTYTPEQFKKEFEYLVNPPLQEMNATLQRMEKNYAQDKQRNDSRKKKADTALKNKDKTWKLQDQIAKADIEYLSENKEHYQDDERERMTLDTLGLSTNSVIPFEGKNMTPQEIQAISNELSKKNQEGAKQIEDYKKAINSKIAAEREKMISETVLGIQIIVSLGSIIFPPLALLDISITICEWLRKPNPSGVDTAMGAAGIAFDIIGLIPFFGKPLKLLGKSMTSSELYDAYRLNQLYTSKLAQMDQRAAMMANDFKETVTSFRADSAAIKTEFITTTSFSNGLSKGVNVSHAASAASDAKLMSKIDAASWSKEVGDYVDSAFDAIKAPKPNVTDAGTAASWSKEVGDYVDSAFDAIKAPTPNVTDAGIVLSAEEDAIHALASELEATIQIDGKATIKTMSLQNVDEVIAIMKNISEGQVAKQIIGSSLLNASDGWLYTVGIGYNGICFINGLLEGIEGNASYANPMTPEEKAMREQQVNAILEIQAAGQEVAAAREALKNATTDAEREKARNDLKQAEQHQKEAQGFYDMRHNEKEPEQPTPTAIDAEAELKRAEDDKMKAEKAYQQALAAKDAEAQEAALNALDNANKREEAALTAVNAQRMAYNMDYDNDAANAAQALNNWDRAYDNLEAVENRQDILQNNPNIIANLEKQNSKDSTTALEAMYNAEEIKGYTNQYNAANLANQLSGETQYGYDLAFAQNNEDEAFNQAALLGDVAAESWAAQVNADLTAQDLKWVLENGDKKEEE